MIVFTQRAKRVPKKNRYRYQNPCEGCCFEVGDNCAISNVDPSKLDCEDDTMFELVSEYIQQADDE